MTKSKVNTIFGPGISQKVRLTLGTMQGTSSTLFFTAADIAGDILSKEYPNATLEDFRNATMLVSNALTAMDKNKSNEIFRSTDKISSRNKHPAWISNKVAVGFRVGVCISTPIVNADNMVERRQGKELAEALNKNPLEALRTILPLLTDSQLTDAMMDIMAIKDERMLTVRNDLANARVADNRAAEKAKIALQNALEQLTGE